ncbi:hypothetical protein [Thiothrix lacustris]|uniref:hypothetical protein n=1 Tax=Thiothrix lacustris TaxID=525917 RepID=UPI0027E47C7C|nr:hypothetical protein [Thiothrix lacustris]WMP15855.1 hypothetical protein RCS87_10650 [Thiothrix lacustris]
MSDEPTTKIKHEVATELLDWAIRSFLSGNGYYSALHLAGAAEEVFAVYLRAPEYKLTPANEEFTSLFLRISQPSDQQERNKLSKWVGDRMNNPKNSVKHKRGHQDEFVEFDPVEEAADVIDRAISNYIQLLGKLPLRDLPSIHEFDVARHETSC